jgi:flagellar hook-associated protein 2
MTSPITFSGLGSGIDTKSIVDALVAVERIPIQQLEDRKATEQKKLDLIGTLKGLVSSLKDKAKGLSTLGEFLAFTVSPSVETAATFSASGTAVAGSHTLNVQQLAASDRWAFDGVADPDVDLASADGQSVDFTYDGTTYSVPLTQAGSSLNEIAGQINTATNGAVNATVVNTGTASAPDWRLVLAAKDTGADYRITGLSTSVAGLTLDSTPPDPQGLPGSRNNIVVGSNAVALIDGLVVTRSDNDFSDVVAGVSISLLEADPATTVTFTVEPDKTAIKKGVQDFVDAFNAVVDFVKKQNTYDEDSGPGGELFGDNIMRTVMNTVRGALFNQSASQVASDTIGYGTLSLLGVKSDKDGRLSIDAAAMDKKLDANLDAFADLFVDSDGFDNGGALPGTPGYYVDLSADTGLMDDLVREIDRVVNTYQDASGGFSKGIFDTRTDTLNANIKLFDQQIDAKEVRLEMFQRQLETRFAALESTMAQLNSQQAYLTGVTFNNS